MIREANRRATVCRHHVDISAPVRVPQIKSNRLPVGRPCGRSAQTPVERGQLQGVPSILVGYPDLLSPRPQALEHDAGPIGRELRVQLRSCRSDHADRSAGRLPRPRECHAVGVLVPAGAREGQATLERGDRGLAAFIAVR